MVYLYPYMGMIIETKIIRLPKLVYMEIVNPEQQY